MPLVKRGQDTATWLKILRTEKYAYGIEEPLVNYRIVGNSLSSNKIKALKRTWNTYRNVEGLGLFKSMYVFCFYEEPLVNYRIVGNSLSSNKIKALKRTWNTYRNVEGLGLFKSMYVFCFYVVNAIRKRL